MARTRLTFLRDFTRRFGNPILRHVAPRLPGFCILEYVGRRTGRTYRIPMNVFRPGETWVFVLTYGSEVQWVKNVLAAGRCQIETRGRVIPLARPELVVDPSRRRVPRHVALFLGLIGVTEFLLMHEARGQESMAGTEGAGRP